MLRSRILPPLAAALLLLSACADGPLQPAADLSPLRVTANVSGTTVTTLVIAVSAADIAGPLIFNLASSNGVASGTVQVPPGTGRTFRVEAFDATGAVTHDGVVTVDVQRGMNPPLSITLAPRSGQVPITIGIGGLSVVVTPATAALDLGEEVQLTANVTDASGNAVPGAVVAWATSNPGVASVDASGRVRVVGPGEADVVATFSGFGGTSRINVTGEILPETITVGAFHSCGLTFAGEAYCWGANTFGQLGTGGSIDRDKPAKVAGNLSFRQISAGAVHTVAVTTDGVAYTWGNNTDGQLGDGTTTHRPVPVPVSGSRVFRQVSAGGFHTVGLTSAGAAYAWGQNSAGQLGDGSGTDRSTPVAVATKHLFTQVSAGAVHTVGLTADGAAYAWGANSSGALGDGTTEASSTLVRVSSVVAFREVSAGDGHTLALDADGFAHAWGSNWRGQLGDGSVTQRLIPVPVAGGRVYRQISAGAARSMAVTETGEAWAWGSNEEGRLGDGTVADSHTPVAISGGRAFRQIRTSSSSQHSVAVTMAGAGYAWGQGQRGQLGEGCLFGLFSCIDRSTPVPISEGHIFR